MANNLAAFNAQAWSKLLIKNLDQINVMLPLVNRDYEGEIQNLGDTVQVRTLGSVTMGAWTKNGTISYSDLAPVKEAMTIADAEYFAFRVDDVDVAQNDLDALNLYAKRAAVAVNNTIEAKLMGFYTGALAANQITGASAAALTLTASNVYQYIVAARTALSQQNVPMTGRWLVVNPITTSLLLQSSQFIRATDLGDRVVGEGDLGNAPARPGFIGRVAGFEVYESNQVVTTGGATYLPFGTNTAISYAAQIKEVELIRLETTFASAVRGLLLHDGKVFAEASKSLGYIKAA